MRYLRLCFACLVLALAAASSLHAAPTARPVAAPKTVLFVGNSFTFYNNSLHTHLRQLLIAADPELVFPDSLKSMTISGARLADHEGGLKQMLESYDWDFVVLQGHSLEAVDPEQSRAFRSSVERFAQLIRDDDARPMLFMTWAYSGQPGMTADLDHAYRSIGDEAGVLVVPVGLAFARAGEEIEGIELRTADGKHPTLEGTYLAACVFYGALFALSPLPLTYDAGLDPALARDLRRVAWQTLESYYGSKQR